MKKGKRVINPILIVYDSLAVIPAQAGIQLTSNGCPPKNLGHDDKDNRIFVFSAYFASLRE